MGGARAGAGQHRARRAEDALSPAVLQLAGHFALLSLVAFGGAHAVVPDMHRVAVDVHHWMTDAEFADLFAIAQASPGPNMLIVSLIGFRAAGLAGGLVATAAMCGPSCVLTFVITQTWTRFRDTTWRLVVQAGLAAVTVGLVLGSGYVLTRAADHTPAAYALTAVTVLWMLATRLNPLWLLAGAAALGLLGVV